MFIPLISYLLLSFALLYACARISYKLKFVDIPSARKTHAEATAFTGGIGISFSFIFSIFLFDVSNIVFNLILFMSFLMSIIGFIDDKFNLNAINKLSLQFFPILYLIIFQDLSLIHLGDYNYFKFNLGIFAIPFTLICTLFLVNAFNYFDGTDGTISFSTISILGILYFLYPNQEFLLYLIMILIPLSLFICFNFSIFRLPKMFLGDSGSLLLGFVISFILIYLANQDLIHPIVLAWSIAIFVYEFLSINFIRLIKKKNIFIPGRDHLHHILFNKNKSIFLTNFMITILNFILFSIGYLSFIFISPFISFFLFILLCFIFLSIRYNYA